MSEEYPEFIEPLSPYCLVRARAASIHADGPDDGSNPDWMPAVNQKVVFTPSISGQLLTYDAGTDDSIIVTVEPVDATTNADGWFVSKSGKRIYLLATDDPRLSVTGWTWSVNINRRDIRFSAPSGGVVDLAQFVATPAVDAVERLSVAQVAAEYVALHHEELVGEPGRAVELQTTATHVQWRYEGDSTWTDIIALDDLVGEAGPAVELRTSATHIQWRLVGGDWADLVPLSALVGPAGPPNVLTKGTVTTGPPGSEADFSITGTAPEQVLNLTIPTGATGAVSAWEYYAAGRPDIVGTLDAAALAWRNAAPSGSTFYSTDGPQGAWVWRKRGTTWVCVEGDTGWLTLATTAHEVLSTSVPPIPLHIRRVDGMVSLAFYSNSTPQTGLSYPVEISIATLPAGFRASTATATGRMMFTMQNSYAPNRPLTTGALSLRGDGVIQLYMVADSGSRLQGQLRFSASDPWPTTLTL